MTLNQRTVSVTAMEHSGIDVGAGYSLHKRWSIRMWFHEGIGIDSGSPKMDYVLLCHEAENQSLDLGQS